jgi:general secretion pathway protein L
MTLSRDLVGILSLWLDSVAATIVATFERFVSPRIVQLLEEDGSVFTLQAPEDGGFASGGIQIVDGSIVGALPENLLKAVKGSRVEIVLRPFRFLFRPLELPRRAAEFLDGIVRAQIDRLTPWAASDAVFGWGRPTEIANDRISIIVAATKRAMVNPFVQAASELGAASIAIFTSLNDSDIHPAKIKVYDQNVRGMLDARRVSTVLLAILLVAGAAACLSISADMIVGGNLEAEQLQLVRRIADRRAAIRAGQDNTSRATVLDRRKQETPATVIVLEALSQVLPDHTYVTELRVEGSKLQVVGVTRDAPELIRLIEQSPHFTRATFFAPTTRSPSDPGERFHIQARIEPVNTPRT